MWLVVCGYVIESVTCVAVQWGKTLCFMISFTMGFIFDEKV